MGFKAIAFILLGVVAAGSVAARALDGDGTGPTVASSSEQASGLVAADTPSAEEAETGVRRVLPYLSEASFFALIGFALGFATKKIVKLGLLLLALIFVAIQMLTHADVVDVDWSKALEFINGFILNVNENATIQDFLKDRIATAGGFILGYVLGFRKG